MQRVIAGGPESVHAQLVDLAERSGADELMLVSQVTDVEQRIRGLERVAQAFELAPQPVRQLAARAVSRSARAG